MAFVLSAFRWMNTSGAMILGMGLYKAGFLTGRRPTREYVLLALGGYAVAGVLVSVGLWHVYRSGVAPLVVTLWMSTPATIVVPCATIANVSLIILLARGGRMTPVFRPLAAVGCTALSNYILTSLVCKFLFSWGPWKLYDRLDYPRWFLVTGAVWALNPVLSTLWLRSFAFGPLEWLWRSLTYWKRQPFLLRDVGV